MVGHWSPKPAMTVQISLRMLGTFANLLVQVPDVVIDGYMKFDSSAKMPFSCPHSTMESVQTASNREISGSSPLGGAIGYFAKSRAGSLNGTLPLSDPRFAVIPKNRNLSH